MQHIELLNYESLVEKVFPKNLFHTKMIHIFIFLYDQISLQKHCIVVYISSLNI